MILTKQKNVAWKKLARLLKQVFNKTIKNTQDDLIELCMSDALRSKTLKAEKSLWDIGSGNLTIWLRPIYEPEEKCLQFSRDLLKHKAYTLQAVGFSDADTFLHS